MPEIGQSISHLLGKMHFLVAALILTGGSIAVSQTGRRVERPTFSARVEIVNVFVSVCDKKGRFVRDLLKEDFTLKEEGRKQTISYFSRETSLPLTIGLVVDTSPSLNKMMEEERDAGLLFLNSIIRPGKDHVFLMQFGEEQSGKSLYGDTQYEGWIELIQDLTSTATLIEEGINLLGQQETMIMERPLEPRRSPAMVMNTDFNTMLADSICVASENILKQQSGRKAIVILGDGFHVGYKLGMAVTAAQKADVLIYTIRMYDKGFGGNFGEWETNLKTLSKETGGTYFEMGKKQTLAQIFAKIEEELRSQYNLGYIPDKNDKNGFRKIEVRVRKKGMVVKAREGYYARK